MHVYMHMCLLLLPVLKKESHRSCCKGCVNIGEPLLLAASNS